jgi:DNA invertase Pin-like site-specific DNA recombinase
MATQRQREPGIAAIYARVSTERQAIGDRTSLDRQVKNCERTAARLGLTITSNPAHVIREAHSASDPDDRPGIELLQRAARMQPQPFRYVLMDVIDRTTRVGAFDLGEICNTFLRAGVEPIWASHPDWDMRAPHDRNEAAKEAIKAYEDKETIARRFQNGKGERIENGQLIRCYLAYGYKWNAEKPRYRSEYDDEDSDPRTEWLLDDEPSPNGTPAPAKVVERIYTYLAEAYRVGRDGSGVDLMHELNAQHVPTPSQVKGRRRRSAHWQGKPAVWRISTISYIVKNPGSKSGRLAEQV